MRLHFDLILRNGIAVTPSGRERVDIGITAERIAAIGDLSAASAIETFDASSLHVLPGVIDTQCHFREPGFPHKEDLSSGSASAALGGVTGFFEMPNTNPSTDNAERLAWKVQRAKETSWVDFAFYVGATTDNVEQLATLEQLEGCVGTKMFCGSSTGSLLVDKAADQLRVFRSGRRRVACHSEDEARLKERKGLFDGKSVHAHPEWRDEECAVKSTQSILELARLANRKLHVLHVTTAGELPLLEANKDLATFETTPQHLTLAAPECYDKLGTLAQMNPPIRESHHREALWRAVRSGMLDVLATDHAPHTLEEKAKPWPQSPSGMPGVQTLVPVMLTHVNDGKLSLERFVDLTSAGPARVFNLRRKGRLAVGFDADFTIVDLSARHTITQEWSRSRCGWTPFEGFHAHGWPVATVVRGRFIMRDGALAGTPAARPMSFDP